MAYTHYWARPARLSAEAFAGAIEDCRRVLPELHVPLAGPDGTGRPVVRSDAIVFNGLAEASRETFAIRLEEVGRGDGRPPFSFCKTEHQPYDLAAQVALIVFQHHLGRCFRVNSDGNEADWDAARRWCQQHLGYGGEFRLDSD